MVAALRQSQIMGNDPHVYVAGQLSMEVWQESCRSSSFGSPRLESACRRPGNVHLAAFHAHRTGDDLREQAVHDLMRN